MMNSPQVVSTDDILLKLCNSVSHVLSSTTASAITHASMVQKISRTRLMPGVGCFSVFEGGFSGLVVVNFTAGAAIEIYRKYMLNMGIPESELAFAHTSDEVGNVMGELMNQMLGDFINKMSKELQTSINQSQPKMLALSRELNISIDANLDKPVANRVAFRTEGNHIFYLEFAMDKTEFTQLEGFENDGYDLDSLIEQHSNPNQQPQTAQTAPKASGGNADDLLDELGI